MRVSRMLAVVLCVVVSLLGVTGSQLLVPRLLAAPDMRNVVAHVASTRDEQDSEPFENCRLGASMWAPQWDVPEFDLFNFGLYLDFGNTRTAPSSLQYWRMVRVKQDRDPEPDGEYLSTYSIMPSVSVIAERATNNPGSLWIVGNEPDRESRQDDTYPEVYAQAYHEVYTALKAADPTAQVAVAGLVGFTPGRAQYFDIVWDTYLQVYGTALPADVWTIHPYVLWESGGSGAHVALGTDPSLAIPYSRDCEDPTSICHAEHDDLVLFEEQIVRMREWMWRHGQQRKPLLVTEWGVLLPYEYEDGALFYDENGETFNPERVSAFMEASSEFFRTARDTTIGLPGDDYHMVQQWAWFALSIGTIEARAGNLVEPDAPYETTELGKAWQDYVATIPAYVNLAVDANSVVALDASQDVTLAASVYNNGNIGTGASVTATFYSDEALTQVLDTIVLPPQSGCSWGYDVAAIWPGPISPGYHPYWVKVTSSAPESDVGDNVTEGYVFVEPERLWLPLVMRSSH